MVVHQWDIYTIDLNPVIGSEQGGFRPAIVVSSNLVNHLNQVTILPITSIKKPDTFIYPNEVFLSKNDSKLSKDSIIMAHQIRSVDKKRLTTFVSNLKDEDLRLKIMAAEKFQLDI